MAPDQLEHALLGKVTDHHQGRIIRHVKAFIEGDDIGAHDLGHGLCIAGDRAM
jgi:hypothetical protein